jgi:hypothetical protein
VTEIPREHPVGWPTAHRPRGVNSTGCPRGLGSAQLGFTPRWARVRPGLRGIMRTAEASAAVIASAGPVLMPAAAGRRPRRWEVTVFDNRRQHRAHRHRRNSPVRHHLETRTRRPGGHRHYLDDRRRGRPDHLDRVPRDAAPRTRIGPGIRGAPLHRTAILIEPRHLSADDDQPLRESAHHGHVAHGISG